MKSSGRPIRMPQKPGVRQRSVDDFCIKIRASMIPFGRDELVRFSPLRPRRRACADPRQAGGAAAKASSPGLVNRARPCCGVARRHRPLACGGPDRCRRSFSRRLMSGGLLKPIVKNYSSVRIAKMNATPPVRLALDKVVVRVTQLPLRRPIAAQAGRVHALAVHLDDVLTEQGVIGYSYLAPYRSYRNQIYRRPHRGHGGATAR